MCKHGHVQIRRQYPLLSLFAFLGKKKKKVTMFFKVCGRADKTRKNILDFGNKIIHWLIYSGQL